MRKQLKKRMVILAIFALIINLCRTDCVVRAKSQEVASVLCYVNTSERMYEPRKFDGIEYQMSQFLFYKDRYAGYIGGINLKLDSEELVDFSDKGIYEIILYDAWGEEIYRERDNVRRLVGDPPMTGRLTISNAKEDVVKRAYDYTVSCSLSAQPVRAENPKEYYYQMENRAADLLEEKKEEGFSLTINRFSVDEESAEKTMKIEAELENQSVTSELAYAVDFLFVDGYGKLRGTARTVWRYEPEKENQIYSLVLEMPVEYYFYEVLDYRFRVSPLSENAVLESSSPTEEPAVSTPVPTCDSEEEYLIPVTEGVRKGSLTNTSPYLYEKHEVNGWELTVTECYVWEDVVYWKASLFYQEKDKEDIVIPRVIRCTFYDHQGKEIRGAQMISKVATERSISYSTNIKGDKYSSGIDSFFWYSYEMEVLYLPGTPSERRAVVSSETLPPSEEPEFTGKPMAASVSLSGTTVSGDDSPAGVTFPSEEGSQTDGTTDLEESSSPAGTWVSDVSSFVATGITVPASPVSVSTSPVPTSSVADFSVPSWNLREKLSVMEDGNVKLTWKKYAGYDGYRIYRSKKKKSGYALIKSIGKKKSSYIDRNVKRGATYFYQIVPILKGRKVAVKRVLRAQLPPLAQPVIAVSKGKSGNKYYVQVRLKRYEGSYAKIYVKKDKDRYRRLAVKKKTIQKYGKIYRFLYQKKGILLTFKARTYQAVKGKKRYSAYSLEKRIRT